MQSLSATCLQFGTRSPATLLLGLVLCPLFCGLLYALEGLEMAMVVPIVLPVHPWQIHKLTSGIEVLIGASGPDAGVKSL